jgi:hypothetical protein
MSAFGEMGTAERSDLDLGRDRLSVEWGWFFSLHEGVERPAFTAERGTLNAGHSCSLARHGISESTSDGAPCGAPGHPGHAYWC